MRIRENFSHIRTKAKKDQLLEDRFTEIERENRILLEKMHHIFQNKKQNTMRTLPKGSLNYGYRKKVLTQIEVENKSMLERLRNKSSCYSARIWEKDRKNTEKRLKSIGEYPYSIGERGKTAFRSIKAPSLNTNLVYKKEIPIRNR